MARAFLKPGQVIGKFKTKSGMDFVIRTPRYEDTRKLLEYINALVEENTMIRVNEKQTIGEERKFIKEQVQNNKTGTGMMLLATRGNEILGVCDIKKGLYKEKHTAVIGISVARGFRSQGVGRALMGAMIKLAKWAGVRVIYLEVLEGNAPAIALYKKLGFVKTGVFPEKALHNGKYLDSYLMALKLVR